MQMLVIMMVQIIITLVIAIIVTILMLEGVTGVTPPHTLPSFAIIIIIPIRIFKKG